MEKDKVYTDLLTEITNLSIPHEHFGDGCFWIPRLCSNANENDEPLIYVAGDSLSAICWIGKTKKGYLNAQKQFNEITSKNYHKVLVEILKFYYEEIDKTP